MSYTLILRPQAGLTTCSLAPPGGDNNFAGHQGHRRQGRPTQPGPLRAQETQLPASRTQCCTPARVREKQERTHLKCSQAARVFVTSAPEFPPPRNESQPEKPHHWFPMLTVSPFRGKKKKAAHCRGSGGPHWPVSDPAGVRSGRLRRPWGLSALPRWPAQDRVSLTLPVFHTVPKPHKPQPGSLINYANVWRHVGGQHLVCNKYLKLTRKTRILKIKMLQRISLCPNVIY